MLIKDNTSHDNISNYISNNTYSKQELLSVLLCRRQGRLRQGLEGPI